MVLTITPYVKKGLGTISTSGSSTTTGCDNVRGFRNVAVGATITADGLTRTVVSKTNEQTINIDSAWSLSNDTWTFLNPPLVISGLYSYRTEKFDRGWLIPIVGKDADRLHATRGDGIYRETLLNCCMDRGSL